MGRFTDRFLAEFQRQAAPRERLADDGCKGLRARKNRDGSLSFVIKIRIKGGQVRDYTLGSHHLMTIEEARAQALTYRRLCRDGIDPADHEAEVRLEQKRARAIQDLRRITLREIAATFSDHKDHSPKTRKDYTNTFKNHCQEWLERPVSAITKSAIENKLLTLRGPKGNANRPATAKKLQRYLGAVLNFCTSWEIEDGVPLLDANPAARISIRIETPSREVELGRMDINQILDGLEHVFHGEYQGSLKGREYMASYMVLALFTGLRLNEICHLRWDDITLDGDNPLIYVRKAKNDRRFVLPVTPVVGRFLEKQHQRTAHLSEWVFPARNGRQTEKPMSNPTKNIKAFSEDIGIEFSSHILRHLFGSTAYSLGFEDRQLRRVMRHGKKDVTDIYVHATAERMRPLYELIEEKLLTDWDPGMAPGMDAGEPPLADELLEPDREDEGNVVRFRGRQAEVS